MSSLETLGLRAAIGAAVVVATGLTVLVVSPGVSGQALRTPASEQRALVDKYCVTCHNGRLETAGLALDGVNLSDVGGNSEIWEKVLRKLRTGAMPPLGLPAPDRPTSDAFVASLGDALDRAAAAHPNPGRPVIHRLNRTEYTNAVRDLLSLEIDGRSLLPGDDADKHGFDNIADVLSVSPSALERYMSAARKISRLAVGRADAGPIINTYAVPKTLQQDQRLSEELPLGSQGGIAIRHYFPVDGEYTIKIRLQRNLYDVIRGLGRPHQLEIRLDGHRIKLFTVGGEEMGQTAPVAFGGTIDGNPEWEKYARQADAGLDARVLAKAGMRIVAVSFLAEQWVPDEVLQPRQSGFGRDTNEMFDGYPAVDNVTIGGPYGPATAGETPSRRMIFVCRPAGAADEAACAQRILSTLARRAYRRPATESDLRTLMRFYESRKDASFDARIELALQMILASPNFLFRVERDPANVAAGTAYRVSDLELASRLSFFLWSSVPDDQLLDLAVRGKLKDPRVLGEQVQRMLADARSKALVDNFAGQWLMLRNIRDVTPDPDVFPDFDENLRMAFQRETELFIESQMRSDRSVMELLTANYTFVNERLARHYGIPDIYGDRFRRVTFADDRRGGLLGQGSVLTVTSYPNRTSPVLRGKWLLENILGTPPPEPPPDVPALKEKGDNGQPQSVRERLELHRTNPPCASCHAPMDPLGFALENFDAIGAWRTRDAGVPIDSVGALSNGTTFAGLAGLRGLLVSQRREQFISTLVEKLLTYALGRGVESYDQPTVRAITKGAASKDARWSSIILGVVRSTPFQMRRSRDSVN